MYNEYRYLGATEAGKPVSGVIVAQSSAKAKRIIAQIAQKNSFRLQRIIPKKPFLYQVKLPNGKKVKGRQDAFTKEELSFALQKMGYADIKVQPVLLDFKVRPGAMAILMFVNLSAFMLREKMPYDKILSILGEEEDNRVLRETIKKIQGELKRGKEGREVFSHYADVFGKFPAYMLGLATSSGNMAEVYESTVKFMERDADYRKSLKQAILTPAFTVLALLAAVLYYVLDIFPSTAKLFVKFGMDVPPLTKGTLWLSDYLLANWWWIITALIVPVIITLLWWRTSPGRVQRDKMLIRLPIIGPLMHKSSIEIFFRVFGTIYSGSENNVETIRASAEACRNAYIEKGVKEIAIPLMLKEGMGLVPALTTANVFNKSTLSRLRTGSETGNVLIAAQQISNFYEKETKYKMTMLIESIQTFIGIFIGLVVTLLTIVSAEIAMVSPKTPGM